MTMSEDAHTSSAESMILAPAAMYCSSVMPDPLPALFSMSTSWPAFANASAPSGVTATRPSSFLISFGTPMIILDHPF